MVVPLLNIRATLQFIQGDMSGIRKALKGE